MQATRMKKVVLAVFVVVVVAVGNVTPVSAEYIPSPIADQFASAAKQIIIEVVDFLTPIIDVICAGMIIIGVILAAGLRQEFYGIRLVIGGGVGLLVMHVVIPVLLSFL